MAVQYNLIKQDVFEGLKTLDSDSYDLCINSSKLGVEGTKKLIIQAIEDFENCR